MASTVKNALTAGAVVGGALILIVTVVSLVLLPLGLAAGWFFGWISFEAAVIGMLLVVAYLSGDFSNSQ